ncbi:hypothetical protein IAD21_02371 [Abditibacteriota bacterium]|nr:hypothetical protein IAD21_02371 [Abditibacteriota bacterium]
MKNSILHGKLPSGVLLLALSLLSAATLYQWHDGTGNFNKDRIVEDGVSNSLVEDRTPSKVSVSSSPNTYTLENAVFFSLSKLKSLAHKSGDTTTFDLGDIGLDASQIDDMPIMARSVSLSTSHRIIVKWSASGADYENNEQLIYDRKKKILIRKSQGFSFGSGWNKRTVMSRGITDNDFRWGSQTADYSHLDQRGK